MPMDIEWAKDADDGQLYVIQARPETVASRRAPTAFESYSLKGTAPVLATGRAVGEKIATGPTRVIADAHELAAFQPGEVLVTESTSPDWEPVMKIAAAIVTERGGRTCHAAIVARELGVPAVVGAAGAMDALRTGRIVTVSCAEGEVGRVYDGKLPFETTQIETSNLKRPRTAIMLNLGNPELAFRSAMLPNDGVGLARMEFIISEHIGVHPMALVNPEKVTSASAQKTIQRLVRNYARPADYFIEKLSEGVGVIAAAFYPKPVIVRLSDFKTNEYARLIGGDRVRTQGREPDARFPGCSTLCAPCLCRWFCSRMRRPAPRSAGHGTDQSVHHGSVLPAGGGGSAGARCDGKPWSQAWREWPRDLRHVRNPEQRHPSRCVCRSCSMDSRSAPMT